MFAELIFPGNTIIIPSGISITLGQPIPASDVIKPHDDILSQSSSAHQQTNAFSLSPQSTNFKCTNSVESSTPETKSNDSRCHQLGDVSSTHFSFSQKLSSLPNLQKFHYSDGFSNVLNNIRSGVPSGRTSDESQSNPQDATREDSLNEDSVNSSKRESYEHVSSTTSGFDFKSKRTFRKKQRRYR